MRKGELANGNLGSVNSMPKKCASFVADSRRRSRFLLTKRRVAGWLGPDPLAPA